MSKLRRHASALFLLFCLFLSGCGLIDAVYLAPPEDTAQEIFEAGNDALKEKQYLDAIGYFTKLKDNYPFSPYAIEAEISLGDAYYLDEDYFMAAETYKDFESLHPRNEAIPYVLVQIALSDMKSYISVDRPPTALIEAAEYLNRVREEYPNSEYAVQAEALYVECRRQMAEHELYNADFFMRIRKYGAAWKRYAEIVKQFPDVPTIADVAKERGRVAFLRHIESMSEKERDSQLGHWKRYFDWL